jgi:hypothetical protein
MGNVDNASTSDNKKGILIILAFVVILAFGFIWSFATNDKTDKAAAPATTVHALNDPVLVNAFTYTVNAAERNGEIVTLKVHAINDGDNPAVIYNGTIRLIDGNGKLYDAESNGVSNGDINPGIASEGEMVYRVPASATGLKAAITHDAVASTLGNDTKYTYIDLEL